MQKANKNKSKLSALGSPSFTSLFASRPAGCWWEMKTRGNSQRVTEHQALGPRGARGCQGALGPP